MIDSTTLDYGDGLEMEIDGFMITLYVALAISHKLINVVNIV